MTNMVKQIIPADSYKTRKDFKKDGKNFLNISEFFYDTIQGEGINIGQPASFLRMQRCSLDCSFCDTNEVWRYGSPYSFDELFELMPLHFIYQLSKGQHLVLTGGSPLLQQVSLIDFLNEFIERFGFKPFIEVENECVIKPMPRMVGLVDCWNNSPKLENSKNPFEKRWKPEVIHYMSQLPNSWFKFVVSSEEDWNEIDVGFLMPQLIRKDQVILMPEGATRVELDLHKSIAFELAVENSVRYATREHIVLWDKKTGV